MRRTRDINVILWVLYQVLNDVLAEFAGLLVADVDPVVGARWGALFPNELVEGLIHEPGEPFLAGGFIRNMDVTGFTSHVLGIGYTTYGFVQGLRAVAAADYDGAVEVFTQGFEDVDAELLQVADHVE